MDSSFPRMRESSEILYHPQGDPLYYWMPEQACPGLEAGSGMTRKVGDTVLKRGSQPVSRVLSWTTIHLGCMSPYTSSGLPGGNAGHIIAPLFGLAPGGVYHAVPVASHAVRSYRTFSPLPGHFNSDRAVYFLWHFPSAHAAQELPGALPLRSPDFPLPEPDE